ncbi:DUF262 domain-containing protein [Thiothrix unzii]|jgi:uncharacterized protein with ParB-like and HNH nuclease domain|uniref:DUF262 domain-containing protein n=1 Tax=Thiothrix unzii TaxID=111769 RepID=UPI002A35C606|nr:DUF262 domain-containing protein [Thiothrix unzii]MDX9989976.1 DUF262 domain-containing protein [Thiothrix unzii]
MSYNKKSIYQSVRDIDEGRMFLPALQRRFVWGRSQIELLFDSIMRGYPIGSCLFWNLARDMANNYVFYEFKKSYDERNPFNDRKIGAFTPDQIIGVLDGQQRLSSIYIGLQGNHAEKEKHKRANNPDAYKKKHLYLNVLSLPYQQTKSGSLETDETRNFEFRFLSDDAVKWPINRRFEENTDRQEYIYWFRVGDIMLWPQAPDTDYYIDQMISKCTNEKQGEAIDNARRVIRHGLNTFYKRVREEHLINYFEVSKDDLEDILKIFVRVNSGGTILSKTDLLFSTIVATWDNGREEIEGLQKTINKMGLGFGFGTEYLMRCCLVLSDAPVVYKVNSFKAENVQAIRDQWNAIAQAIIKTVELLVEFGFSQETLTSNNATIPIAYYIYKNGVIDDNSKSNIRLYMIHSLLKRVFGSSQDQLMNHLRNALRSKEQENGRYKLSKEYVSFDFTQLTNLHLPSGKSLKVTGNDIDRFLEHRKGADTFAILQLFYPQLRYREVSFHQDHIHPAAGFNKEAFSQLGLTQEEQELWMQKRDQLPNLQLLEGRQNQSKNAKPLADWISDKKEYEFKHFTATNFFPEGIGMEFSSFPIFFEARREMLRAKLFEILCVTEPMSTPMPDEEIERLADEDIEGAVFQISEGGS